MPTTEFPLNPAILQRRGSARRKRFLVASMAGLAVLAAVLGVSFLGATGSTTVGVNAASSNFVYPVALTNAVPAAVTSLANGSVAAAGAITTAALPSWSPIVNSAGSVSGKGDLALIDASIASNGVVVNMYVTNLAGLQQDYSSYAFPINIYYSDNGSTWTQASGVVSSPPTYLTNTAGFLSFNLPAPGATGGHKYYDLAMDAGGSYYTTATTSGDLSPSFYFTAQPY